MWQGHQLASHITIDPSPVITRGSEPTKHWWWHGWTPAVASLTKPSWCWVLSWSSGFLCSHILGSPCPRFMTSCCFNLSFQKSTNQSQNSNQQLNWRVIPNCYRTVTFVATHIGKLHKPSDVAASVWRCLAPGPSFLQLLGDAKATSVTNWSMTMKQKWNTPHIMKWNIQGLYWDP